MKIGIQILKKGDWAQLSEAAHAAVFSEKRPPDMDRVDYSLLVVKDPENDPIGYITVRELDKESIYWQYGGATPKFRGTLYPVLAYRLCIDWARQLYKNISTYVDSDNIRYLRLAMNEGFRIIGTRTFDGKIYAELLLRFA